MPNGTIETYTPKGSALAPVQAAPLAETSGQALAAHAKALVEARYIIAMKQPRDWDKVRQNFLKECERPTFAQVAIYRKPIGEGVEGPSIRFVETALQAMGNVFTDSPTIYDDDDKRIVRVTVMDLEHNVTYSKDVTIMKRVERKHLSEGQVALRSRTNSYGKTVYLVSATDDEILNTENALVSKTLRTQGLRLIPGWLVAEGEDAVRETNRDRAAKDPDAAKRKLFDAFGGIGVTVEQIKRYLGHDGATLTPKEHQELLGLHAAIRDGQTTWREVMDDREPAKTEPAQGQAQPAPAATKGTAGVRERLRQRRPAQAPASGTTPAAAPSAPQETKPQAPPPAEVDEHGYDTTGDPEPEPKK